jgi:hypothetical protein
MSAWFDDIPTVIIFERAARREFAALKHRELRIPRRLIYELPVVIPGYDRERQVRIEFPAAPTAWPRITVDGPSDSPHRYGDGALCMFYPGDPVDRRWTLSDGLAALIDTIAVHLFQEEDARHGHGWSGEEAPHAPPSPARRSQPKRRRR